MSATTMNALIRARLDNQWLLNPAARTPAEVVAHLGAVQAQEYPLARWGVGQRALHLTDAIVEAAFDAGEILRTHVLRPTWHFVVPADIRWMLTLTGPRVLRAMAPYIRAAELDDRLLRRAQAVIARALEGSPPLTRQELGAALARARISATGQRLALLVMRAELDGLICSGPRLGRQFTYARMDDRAPRCSPRDRDEALAELTRRYFLSHGPATVHDFAWWSGLTVGDARVGLHLTGRTLEGRDLDGRTFWFAADRPPSPRRPRARSVHLLPIYDECLIAYKHRSPVIGVPARGRNGSRHDRSVLAMPQPGRLNAILIDGRLEGSWGRAFTPNGVEVEIVLQREPDAATRRLLDAALARYARFMGARLFLTQQTASRQLHRLRPQRTASSD
jgi:hypothetical protein